MRLHQLLYFILLWLPTFTVSVNGQATPPEVEKRSFDQEQLERFYRDRDFLYDRPDPSEGFLARWLRQLLEKIRNLFPDGTSDAVWSIWDDGLQYVLMIVAVILVVVLLFRADITALFFRRPRTRSLEHEVLTEDIHALDFEQRIAESVANRQYRLAVRLYYLQTLKLLTDNGKIEWAMNKTNRDYANELRHTPLAGGFAHLTRLFDYVWYGDFPLDEARFAELHADFKHFQQSLPQSVLSA